MLVASGLIILLSMGCVILRGLRGPSRYDRLLAVNAFGTNVVVLIVLLAFIVDNMMFLDVALVYALINFVTTIALMKYIKYGGLGGDYRKQEDL